MSFSKMPYENPVVPPVSEFQYKQMIPETTPALPPPRVEMREPGVRLTEEVLRRRLETARAEGVAEAEARLKQQYDEKIAAESIRVTRAIEDFAGQRKEYFSKVEIEVVQLALAIAGKILHREAQVDPLLVAAIVQIALGQLKEGSVASVRVRPADAARWRAHFGSLTFKADVGVVEDPALSAKDCILETELGTVNFSLDLQLKEIEQGFFDVLAQKPQA